MKRSRLPKGTLLTSIPSYVLVHVSCQLDAVDYYLLPPPCPASEPSQTVEHTTQQRRTRPLPHLCLDLDYENPPSKHYRIHR